MSGAAEGINARVAAAQRGDQSALESVLAEVRAGVVRYLIARRVPAVDADDLAQDVCVLALGVIAEWTETGQSFWGWVFAVVRSRLADRARSAARAHQPAGIHPPDSADPNPGPEEQVLAGDGAERIARLVATLPSTQRDVVLLRVVVGMSTTETAAALGLALGSVHVLQHRAVGRLRRLMAEADTAVAP